MPEGFREVDGKLHVSVEYLRWLQEERRRFNRVNLHDVVLYENGEKLDCPEALIDEFEITGLSNIDFVLCDVYKGRIW